MNPVGAEYRCQQTATCVDVETTVMQGLATQQTTSFSMANLMCMQLQQCRLLGNMHTSDQCSAAKLATPAESLNQHKPILATFLRLTWISSIPRSSKPRRLSTWRLRRPVHAACVVNSRALVPRSFSGSESGMVELVKVAVKIKTRS
jgi:hypothetical protein